MAIEVFVFVLVFFLLLSLALLCCLCWLSLEPSHSQAGRRRAMVHRLLKPRTPLDGPICRLCSSEVRPASVPVRPWREVKSCRGFLCFSSAPARNTWPIGSSTRSESAWPQAASRS